MKKFLSLALAAVLFIGACPMAAGASSGGQRAAEVAIKYLNQGAMAATFGFDRDWCGLFLYRCAEEVGEGAAMGGSQWTVANVYNAANWFAANAVQFGVFNDATLNDMKNNGGYNISSSHRMNRSDYTPQIGDVVFYDWNGAVDSIEHVEIVTDYWGCNVASVGGNTGPNPWPSSVVGIHENDYTNGRITAFARPKYSSEPPFSDIQPGLYSLAPACAPDKRLAVADGSLAIQANVQLGSINATDTAQQWEISSLGGRYYKLICKKSGLALDVAGAGTTEGTNVQQYWWTENKAQYWAFVDTKDGYYQIVPHLNGGLRLDVSGGGSAEGTNVQLWTKNDGTPQKWKLIPVTATPNCDYGHSWGEWKIVKKAAYGVTGIREHTCAVCGKTESETIPALTEPPIGTEIRRKTQYRYHRYEDNNGEYAVCAHWGNTTFGTTMHIAYSNWLDAPLPEVKEGYVNFLEHPYQSSCESAGCLSTDPFEVHRHVDANGKVWYYEETRVCHELAGGGEYYSYPTQDCVRGHAYAPSQNLSTATKTTYICSRCGNLYTGQHGPAGTDLCGSLKSRGGKELGWAITAKGQLSLSSALSQGETVLAACYNADGSFRQAKLITTATPTVKLDPSTPQLKLFWLDSAYSPLSLAHTVWTP